MPVPVPLAFPLSRRVFAAPLCTGPVLPHRATAPGNQPGAFPGWQDRNRRNYQSDTLLVAISAFWGPQSHKRTLNTLCGCTWARAGERAW